MKENVEHIDIPFDELKVFTTAGEEDAFQQILIETLLLSTLAVVHWGKKSHRAKIFITAKSCWLFKDQQKKYAVPLKQIVCMVKSIGHPEIVMITSQRYDNIRLSLTSQERCWAIISAISYQFTYMQNSNLTMINVKGTNLGYFQRSSSEKQSEKGINLNPYPKQNITYEKPFKGMTDIYGHFPSGVKAILEKQIPMENRYGREDHTVYIARLHKVVYKVQNNGRNSHKPRQSFIKDEDDEKFICHYIDKKKNYLQQLYEHRNQDFIEKLIYVKASEYKISVFFQFCKGLRGRKINQQIFIKMWKLYDLAKQIKKQCVITVDSFVVTSQDSLLDSVWLTKKSSQKQSKPKKIEQASKKTQQKIINNKSHKNKNPQRLELKEKTIEQIKKREEENQSVNLIDWQEEQKLVLKQFRYDFLLEYETEMQKFRYEDYPQGEQNCEENMRLFRRKMHNMGTILYELATGRNLFDYHVSEPELYNSFFHSPAYSNKKNSNNRKQSKDSIKSHKKERQVKTPDEELEIRRQMKVLVQIKKKICTRNSIQKKLEIFGKYIQCQINHYLKDFIEKLVWKEFMNEEELLAHPWLQKKQKNLNSSL